MPLVKRKAVPLLPGPQISDTLPYDHQVFLLKVTGEVFLDYESYAARMSYLNSRIFQCESSGKTNLSYFAALESERVESRNVRDKFPDELKGRVLATVQFRIMGRLDALVDLVYERYKDRFFCGEKVFVDIQGEKFFAKISSVFPPASIRNSTTSVIKPETPIASTSTTVVHTAGGVEDYSKLVHKIGTDLAIPIEVAKRDDDPMDYLYTVQLMDEQHTFEGSFTETKASSITRDRLGFSKSILKRYIRECVQRESPVGAPWVVKPIIAQAFSIPTAQSPEAEAKLQLLRDSKTKRRKTKEDTEPSTPGASKRRKTGDHEPVEKKPPMPAAKPIKYPIEDLELDPMSIHDGRILRRVNSELPTLPAKPVPSKELLVAEDLFHDFLMIWNCLNVFSKPIALSPFSIDDFASALKHTELEPRCLLLAEIHACLTNVIATDASRVLGTTGAPPLPNTKKGTGADVVPGSDDVAMEGGEADADADVEAKVDEVDAEVEDEGDKEGDGEEEGEGGEGDEEFDALIRKGISYSKRWDRMAKLKSAEKRQGWERHMIGALCQRGGPLSMPTLHAILKHLFEGADLTAPYPTYAASSTLANDLPLEGSVAGDEIDQLENSSVVNDSAAAVAEENLGSDSSNPAAAYLTLALKDKLDILSYLCTLVLGSKLVRSSIEESETQLTEFRKQRADVNKDRRALLEQKAINEGKLKEEIGALDLSFVANGNGNGHGVNGSSTNGHATPALTANHRDKSMDVESNSGGKALRPPGSDGGTVEAEVEEDEQEDQLDEDDGAEEVKDEDFEEEYTAEETNGGIVGISGAFGARRLALEEKRSEKKALDEARSIEFAQARLEAKAKSVIKKQADKLRLEVEEGLKQNSKKDDFVEREFRRYLGVARSLPLGKDRFFNRYWWFDGIGGMTLVGPNNSIQYGTGRLYVQGPTKEDWADACTRPGGAEAIEERRSREDVDPRSTLQVDEWAFYEDEEQIDGLLSWLNNKGIRELNLKNNLAKWKEYILAGCRKRLADAIAPPAPVTIDSRRSSRTKGGNDSNLIGYLGYVNKIASR